MWEIATIGATVSGNKGSASMLQSVLDNLPPLLGQVHFSVLSVYPEEDEQLNDDHRVQVVPAKPAALILAVPLAALWATLRKLQLPVGPLGHSELLKALERSHVLVDLSGISFVDGRTVELVYNAVSVLPALLMGRRVVKYSQAMGPFRSQLNRTLAKMLLPRLELNIARGKTTLRYLEDLGLEKITLCADAGFSMRDVGGLAVEGVLASLDRFDSRKIVGISASSVVEARTQRRGADYTQVLAEFSNRAIGRGYGIWLIAHSVKESQRGGRTDDVTICCAVYESIQQKEFCQLVIENYPPAALRAIIGECDFFVASRFHAMVSALAKGVPTIVTSWSHKYTEVLEMFKLAEWSLSYEMLSTDKLWGKFEKLMIQEDGVKEKITRHLPEVVASSRRNAALVASLVRGK